MLEEQLEEQLGEQLGEQQVSALVHIAYMSFDTNYIGQCAIQGRCANAVDFDANHEAICTFDKIFTIRDIF